MYSVPLRLSRNVMPDVQVVVVDAEAPEGVEAAAEAMLHIASVAAEAEAAADQDEPSVETPIADGVSEPGTSDDAAPAAQAGDSS